MTKQNIENNSLAYRFYTLHWANAIKNWND